MSMTSKEIINSVADTFAQQQVSFAQRIRDGGGVILDLSMTTISGVTKEIGKIDLAPTALDRLTVSKLAELAYEIVAPAQTADFEKAVSQGLVRTNAVCDTSFFSRLAAG